MTPDATPFISVIVCCFNEEKYIKACIESLVSQNYPKGQYEVIIVDDGSVDETSSICRSFIEHYLSTEPFLKYIRIQHSGLAAARNVGVAMARGDIIGFVDADTIVDQNWLSEVSHAFTSNPEIGGIGGKIEPLNADSLMAKFLNDVFYDRIKAIGANMVFRRAVFDKVGGFYTIFTSRGDDASFLRKAESFFPVVKLQKAIVFHKVTDNLGRWLKERFTTGRLLHIHRAVNKKIKLNRTFRTKLQRSIVFYILNISLPLWVGIYIYSGHPIFGCITLLSVLVILRRLRAFFSFRIPKRLVQNYGVIRGSLLILFSVFIIWVGNFAVAAGFIRDLVKKKNYNLNDSLKLENRIECILSNNS